MHICVPLYNVQSQNYTTSFTYSINLWSSACALHDLLIHKRCNPISYNTCIYSRVYGLATAQFGWSLQETKSLNNEMNDNITRTSVLIPMYAMIRVSRLLEGERSRDGTVWLVALGD